MNVEMRLSLRVASVMEMMQDQGLDVAEIEHLASRNCFLRCF